MPDVSAMDITDECRALVRAAAAPAQVGETVKAAIRRAARRLGLPHGAVKRLWYGERQTIAAHEYLTLKQRLEALQRRAAARADLELDTAWAARAARKEATRELVRDRDAESAHSPRQDGRPPGGLVPAPGGRHPDPAPVADDGGRGAVSKERHRHHESE